MEHLGELLGYFDKLLKIMKSAGEFEIFGYKFFKKTRIDDILCCIIASFPLKYKAFLKRKVTEKKQYSSVISFDVMYKKIKNPFFFNNSIYAVDYHEVIKMINTIMKTLERDISAIEKNF